MPGHWLLARLGKRVLRPGGRELTKQMVDALEINRGDRVIEFAPGLGETARYVLDETGAEYTGIEQDPHAAEWLNRRFNQTRACFIRGSAAQTGLPSDCASVVWGEAMLSMQPAAQKEQIVCEAARLLVPGGRYGIHELCLEPDGLPIEVRQEIQNELSRNIHVGVCLLNASQWRSLLASCGFEVVNELRAPMHLLEPKRMISDEGFIGTVKILWNSVHQAGACERVLGMRRLFRKYSRNLAAVCIVARKIQP
jgi:ubiquinone/menaquinone biosynthesis C-methylase UbiE